MSEPTSCGLFRSSQGGGGPARVRSPVSGVSWSGTRAAMVGDGRFVSGVASGDPTSTSLVLWARVDGPPAPVAWTLTDDDDVVRASGVVRPDDAGVVRVEVDGLRPGNIYRYWFSTARGDGHEEARSPVGRTKTLAARPASIRLGVACCARWPSGEFTGYRALAERDLDLVVHLGDYIYEDGEGGARGAHDPPHECLALEDYDRRYAQYRSDADLQALHAAAPWMATLDDHEIDDNVARFGPTGRSSGTGVDPERRRAGVEAHARWMPQRTHGNGPTPRDRYVAMGDLCDLVLVDTRLGGRQGQVGDGGPAAQPTGAQSPQLLTDGQWEWLDDVVGRSTATWILLASQVQVAPLRLGWWPARSDGGRWPFRIAPVVNPDQWDGYPTERQRLIDLLDRHDRHDVVILSGDLHGRFVTSIRRPGRPDLAEVTTPSISAPTFGSMLDARLPVPSPWTARWIEMINPHIEHLDLHQHGSTVIDVDADTIRMTDAVRPDAWEWTLYRRPAR
jgi:alkaline phosphatase D